MIPGADHACSASITVDFPPLFGPTKTVIPLPALPVGCANKRLCSSEKPRKPSMFNSMTVIVRFFRRPILVDNAMPQYYTRLPRSETSGLWNETGSKCLPTPMMGDAEEQGGCCERRWGNRGELHHFSLRRPHGKTVGSGSLHLSSPIRQATAPGKGQTPTDAGMRSPLPPSPRCFHRLCLPSIS